MKKEYDAIIVGGGPGGLAIGCLLAKEGVSAAIIEKDPALGGRFRSVDFHGCRTDCAIHFMASLVGPVENTSMYQMFKHLSLPLEYKIVPWAMGMVTKEKPGEVEYLAMDPELGAANFFNFFAFATGVDMNDSAKDELMRVADITADMSDEECHKVVNISFADWIDQNVTDPIAQAVMYGMEPIVGASPKDINFGYVAKGFGAFKSHGATLIWYPKNGTLETALIVPMTKYFTDHGGEVITNRMVSSIDIEDETVKGVTAVDQGNRFLMEEYSAPVVICAMPIFQAVAHNILRAEHLTPDWAESIKRCAALSGPDMSGFFLLKEKVVPTDGYGWIHIFDTDYGLPTYIGDLTVGSYVNAIEPPGKQLINSLAIGSTPVSQFGLNPTMETVRAAHRRWKESVEKAFPGFNDAIEYEGINLQLNFTRYAYAIVQTELDIQSPNIKGLYFGGDSIWAVGNPMSDKCFQIAFPLCERILENIRS
ncbi:MAG: NAD(P)-binding protein [Dehalococcoidia bacterium]|nr:MAG: NAD(P)-binding protein [Dehalococcoidia bacterium]UCG82482.1 MAG: NAD(P)-binding protein [Dehalococcoidia bacterium]